MSQRRDVVERFCGGQPMSQTRDMGHPVFVAGCGVLGRRGAGRVLRGGLAGLR